LQFIRARAHSKPLQKHRGGHTNQYFKTVEKHIDRVSDNIAKKFCTEKEKAPKERVLRFIKNEEKQIWMAVAAAFDVAYHLYNTSFLDPSLPWGSYDEEAGKRQSDYLGTPLSPQVIASDESAGAESAEDPE
jgi:hypothetical protein